MGSRLERVLGRRIQLFIVSRAGRLFLLERAGNFTSSFFASIGQLFEYAQGLPKLQRDMPAVEVSEQGRAAPNNNGTR